MNLLVILARKSSVLTLDIRDGKGQGDGEICVERLATCILK
jgi:hypothetical protein